MKTFVALALLCVSAALAQSNDEFVTTFKIEKNPSQLIETSEAIFPPCTSLTSSNTSSGSNTSSSGSSNLCSDNWLYCATASDPTSGDSFVAVNTTKGIDFFSANKFGQLTLAASLATQCDNWRVIGSFNGLFLFAPQGACAKAAATNETGLHALPITNLAGGNATSSNSSSGSITQLTLADATRLGTFDFFVHRAVLDNVTGLLWVFGINGDPDTVHVYQLSTIASAFQLVANISSSSFVNGDRYVVFFHPESTSVPENTTSGSNSTGSNVTSSITTFAATATPTGVQLWDVTNLANIRRAGSVALPGVTVLGAIDSTIYAATGSPDNQSVAVIDASDTANPKVVNTLTAAASSPVSFIAPKGDKLWIGRAKTNAYGLDIYNISNPLFPRILGAASPVKNITFSDKNAIVGVRSGCIAADNNIAFVGVTVPIPADVSGEASDILEQLLESWRWGSIDIGECGEAAFAAED